MKNKISPIRPLGVLPYPLLPHPYGIFPTPRDVAEKIVNRVEKVWKNIENMELTKIEIQIENRLFDLPKCKIVAKFE